MKLKVLVGLMATAIVIVGCAGPQIYKGKVGETPPVVFIERITFYENVEESIQDNKLIKVHFTNEREDELSRKASAAFRKSFLERLKDNGLKIAEAPAPGHPSFIGIKVKMAYKEFKRTFSSTRYVAAQFVLESLDLDLYRVAGFKIFLPSLTIGGHEVPARRAAKFLGEHFADALTKKLNASP